MDTDFSRRVAAGRPPPLSSERQIQPFSAKNPRHDVPAARAPSAIIEASRLRTAARSGRTEGRFWAVCLISMRMALKNRPMAKAAPKRSRRTKRAAAVRKRGRKRATRRTRKATGARKIATPRATRKPATRPKPPALERERRTLTEKPARVPETDTSRPEPRAVSEGGSSEGQRPERR